MMDISAWMKDYVKLVTRSFGNRVWFVGLQGSRARGEATQASDIDVVLILDEVSVQGLEAYSAMLDGLPYRELVCGFLSGKQERENWTDRIFRFLCIILFSFKYSQGDILSAVQTVCSISSTKAITEGNSCARLLFHTEVIYIPVSDISRLRL